MTTRNDPQAARTRKPRMKAMYFVFPSKMLEGMTAHPSVDEAFKQLRCEGTNGVEFVVLTQTRPPVTVRLTTIQKVSLT